MRKLSFVIVNLMASACMAFGMHAEAAEVGEFIPETAAEVSLTSNNTNETSEGASFCSAEETAEAGHQDEYLMADAFSEEEVEFVEVVDDFTSFEEEDEAVETEIEEIEVSTSAEALPSQEEQSAEVNVEEFFNADLAADEADSNLAGSVDTTDAGKVLAEAEKSQEEEFIETPLPETPEIPEEIIPQEQQETTVPEVPETVIPEEQGTLDSNVERQQEAETPQDLQPADPVVSNNDEVTVETVAPADSVPQTAGSVEEAQPDVPKAELPKTEGYESNITRNCQTGDTDILVMYGVLMTLSLIVLAIWMVGKNKNI